MASLEYFLVAESVAVDQMTNRVSVFNIVDDVQAGSAAAMTFPLSQVITLACIELGPEDVGQDFQVTTLLKMPSGHEVARVPTNFTSKGERRRRALHIFRSPKFEEPGEWVFQLLLNGQPLASRGLTVRPGSPPGAMPAG